MNFFFSRRPAAHSLLQAKLEEREEVDDTIGDVAIDIRTDLTPASQLHRLRVNVMHLPETHVRNIVLAFPLMVTNSKHTFAYDYEKSLLTKGMTFNSTHMLGTKHSRR